MRTSVNKRIGIVSTGFIVLLLFLLLLYWLRMWCDFSLLKNAPSEIQRVTVVPSGLFSEDIENDSVMIEQSQVTASFNNPNPKALGAFEYLTNKIQGMDETNTYRLNTSGKIRDWTGLYLDNDTGLLVNISHENNEFSKIIKTYAGSEGVSEVPDEKLGSFSSIIVDSTGFNNLLILYDKSERRFYKIDFIQKMVFKGPQLSKDENKPIQIGALIKNPFIISMRSNPPRINDTNQNEELYLQSFSLFPYNSPRDKFIFVLDETRLISFLDKETLELKGIAGTLPVPDTLFDIDQVDTRDLLSYIVYPISLDPNLGYSGMFAASVNREGTALALSVFDANGQLITTKHSCIAESDISGSKVIYFQFPWAPTLTIMKYLFENLHPPVLSIASYFTADSFEAASGHRALFVLPNSFVAMKARDSRQNFVERFLNAVVMILPSLFLSVFLAGRVRKNAAFLGLAKNEELFWVISTLAFGLVGYITYRLNRSEITLVTCQNCGKSRRPDMEKCHHCNGKWHIPELVPPSWRVIKM